MTQEKFHTQFVFRSPLLPCSNARLEENNFFLFTKQAIFKEAIYLASPALYSEMLKWHEGSLTDAKSIDKLQISLYKYYMRMQSRCTPYGLFAGLGMGEWHEQNKIVLHTNFKKTLTYFNSYFWKH